MNPKSMTWLAVVAFFLVVGYFAWKVTSRSAFEAAEYSVELKDGDFEVRLYPEITLVATPMNLDQQGRDGSFGRLFGYISGKNESEEKVSMTVPVFMDSGDSTRSGTMGFVVPKNVARKGAPAPTGKNVKLKTRKEGRFAVIQFSGILNRQAQKESQKRLEEWMAEQAFTATSDTVEFAGYDPPWTPGSLRRNEVLIRIEDNSERHKDAGRSADERP